MQMSMAQISVPGPPESQTRAVVYGTIDDLCPGTHSTSLRNDVVRVITSDFCVQISRTRAEMIHWSQGRSQNQAGIRPRERPPKSENPGFSRGFLDTGADARDNCVFVATSALDDGAAQCPGNPEKTRGLGTLEASISVGFQA